MLDRTIDVHVGRLRDKLGDAAATPRFIATVRGVGYRVLSAPAAGGGHDLAAGGGHYLAAVIASRVEER